MDTNIGAGARMLATFIRNAAACVCALCIASAAVAAAPQRSFASPEYAASGLVHAMMAHDRQAVAAVLGPGSEQWISSGDAVADRSAADRFVAAFEQKHAVAAASDARASLSVGVDDWPFAFPLVKAGSGWRFDTEAGKGELLARRIGQNELAVINVMRAIVDAQREYASEYRSPKGDAQYARKFASAPGRKDGLYWPAKAGERESPLGPLVTRATAEGYGLKKTTGPRPYHGYYFRMLQGQGPHARGGALDYVVKGRMIGGFAALAYPAQYGNSGVMTFIVNHDGTVFQKDLGADTAKQARAMSRFDPAAGWTPIPEP
jgi:hypothetical protein